MKNIKTSIRKTKNVKRIKAAFFDIDWTLFDDKESKWDYPSIEAIKRLQKQGVKVFICTARPYASFKWLGALDLGIKWDGFVASAGGYAFADGKYIFTSKMERKDVEEFIALALKRKKSLELVELEERKLIAPLNEEGKEHFARFKEYVPPLKEYEGEDVEGINFFADEKEDELFHKTFPHLVYWRYTPYSVDVMPFQHKKGDGIKHVLAYYGFSKDEAMAIGDDLQDLTMAEAVSFFVSMGNGKEEVKKVASFVTKEIWNSGVKYVIDKIIDNKCYPLK